MKVKILIEWQIEKNLNSKNIVSIGISKQTIDIYRI